MTKIQQAFPDEKIEDYEEALQESLQREEMRQMVKPGMEIAIAAGSRGVDKFVETVAGTVKFVQDLGAKPFIVPSMGSHGGATAEGQKAVLAHLGVTEESVNAEVRSSMEVIEIGKLPNGLPVYVDKIASQADGIVVIIRVKPHTAFRGKVESVIMILLTIGVGKLDCVVKLDVLVFIHI